MLVSLECLDYPDPPDAMASPAPREIEETPDQPAREDHLARLDPQETLASDRLDQRETREILARPVHPEGPVIMLTI